MDTPVGKVFGGFIAIILLLLFSATTFYIVFYVIKACWAVGTSCAVKPEFGDGLIYVVTTVGGLVSAFVIAKLSVTEPGKVPTVGVGDTEATTAATSVAIAYLLGWMATGLAALVIGVMAYPKSLQTLSDIGTTWLGLAVSAAYAYFGITPKSAGDRSSMESAPTSLLPDDLTQGQKVPNASETATCGAIAKKIKRTDPEFATLVSNQNASIVFKDEEGTGADRMMSTRLQAKLDALASLVSAEWAGVKLRVTEAWDENDEHLPTALHYEGRAADITTQPPDGAKLGRLARLAVNAGCDWVFYEDTSHVHVSVKKA
ncbi:hypothetical protein [Bradyrhizobium sp. th.b2]|uniref:hypothetical protein n=1 Tax=Bradyrhizobium sp. th-b2 TaxID=172088 RepID=UPI0004181B1E|nr:hypothetical protein [Bradyrhizobium sp. th.b2]